MTREVLRASAALRNAASSAADPAEIVAAAFDVSPGDISIRPTQIRSEITALTAILAAEQPHRVLEIGTSKGGTLYLFAWASADDARLLTIDIQEFHRPRQRLYRSFARADQTVTILAADSTTRETRDFVERHFGGEPLDFLFIDGDHSYEAVSRDFALYAPLVRPGGLVALHDIVDGTQDAVGDVPRFWRELRVSRTGTSELVESSTQGGYGIGLVRV